jgi:hypothetical protein
VTALALGEIETSDTHRFRGRVLIDGTSMDADIAGRITGAKTTRRYDSATALEITVWDDDLLLLTSGLLTRTGKARRKDFDEAAWARFGAMRLSLDGIGYRLAGVSGSYDATTGTLTLTFEDEVASLLRRHKKVMTLRRSLRSRGVFIDRLTRTVKEINIRTFIPESMIVQRVKNSSDQGREKARKKGFAPGKKLTIGAIEITPQQKREIVTSLTVADDLHAGERATIAMLVAGMGESQFQAIANNQGSDYGGVFQGKVKGTDPQFKISDTKGMATYFLNGGKGFQVGGAIRAAADNPDWSAGTIAYKVEGSRSNFTSDAAAEGYYGQFQGEAETMLAAWGGAGEIRLVTHSYSFRTKKKENYLKAVYRIGTEVKGWRLYIDENELVYASDEWLFKRQPTILLQPRTAAIHAMSFQTDVGIPVGEITINAGTAPWVGPPGSVVELEKAGPLNGRWLLAIHERDELTRQSQLTLRQPAKKGPEPAPSREKVTQTETTPEAGTMRATLVATAEKALRNKGDYLYRQIRPYPGSLFGDTKPILLDCSSFVTLIYKTAGAPDPNRRNYDGEGFTGTLWANGTKTNDPQPGDLCFYGEPSTTNAHVALYIGDGEAIGFGSNPIKRHAVKYRNDFVGYKSFDLGGG